MSAIPVQNSNWKFIGNNRENLWVDGAKYQRQCHINSDSPGVTETVWSCGLSSSCKAYATTKVHGVAGQEESLCSFSPLEVHDHEIDRLAMITADIEDKIKKDTSLDPVEVFAQVKQEWLSKLDEEGRKVVRIKRCNPLVFYKNDQSLFI